MICSAYKLMKQGDNIQPWRTPFLILTYCSTSGSNCCFLSCIQISQEAGNVLWCSQLIKNIPQCVVIHTKSLVYSMKQKQIFFWEFPCFFYDPVYVGNLISASSASSTSSLYVCKFSVHVLLKPSTKDFEHNLAGMWDECNYTVIGTLFGIAFIWSENWPFPVLWPLLWKC